MNEEEKRWILEQRARELARVPKRQSAPGEAFLTFVIGDETLALELRYIRQVIAAAQITALPGAAPPLSGVTAWRGQLLHVFELADATAVRPAGNQRLIVIGEDQVAAFRVDRIQDVVELDARSVHPMPVARRRFARGVTADASVVLDGTELYKALVEETL